MKKIGKVILGMLIFLSVNVTSSFAEDINKSPFIGKWAITTFDTPEGDIKLLVEFMVKEGKLAGTIAYFATPEKNAALTKIEVDGEAIEFGYYNESRGYELLYFMEIVEEEKTEGYLLDMFEIQGTKVKEEKKE